MFNTDARRLALLIFVFLGLIYTGIAVALNKSEWAYWVQAVGSITAIIGAYIVGERQASHARRVAFEMQQDSIYQRRRAILECCRLAVSRARLVERIFLVDEYDLAKRNSLYYPDLILSVKALLDGIHPSELGGYKAIARFLELKNELEFLVRSIKVFDEEFERLSKISSNYNAPKSIISNVINQAPLKRAIANIRHHTEYIQRAVSVIDSATSGHT